MEQSPLENLTDSHLVKKFPALYGTEHSLPRSQEVPVICPCPQPARSTQCPNIPPPKDPFEYYLPSTPGPSKWSLSLRIPHQNPLYTSPLPHTRYMPYPSRFFRLYILIYVYFLYTYIKVTSGGLLLADIICHRLIRLHTCIQQTID